MDASSTITDQSAVLTAEQLAGVASGAELKVDVMTACAGLTQARRFTGAGGWSVDVTDLGCQVRASGALDANSVAILTVKQESAATICRMPMQQDTVLIIPGGNEITASILPRLCYTTAVLPMKLWLATDAAVTGREPRQLTGPVSFRVSSETTVRSNGLVHGLATAASARERFGIDFPPPLADYLASVAEAFADSEGRSPAVNRGHRHRIDQAWAAYDYVQSHLDEAITIDTLCRAVGASRRQLEYAFRSVFGVAPHEFVERVRLNECRRRLKASKYDGVSITQIAMDAGFSHLSRFAASYRRLFGELPSVTARTARRV